MSDEVDFLETILARKRDEVNDLESGLRFKELRAKSENAPQVKDFAAALGKAAGIRIIAEIKRKSPSKGWIAPHLDAAKTASMYESGGAAAISVLTDGPGFGGSLDDLANARRSVSLPLLRKDFIIAPSQLIEARAHGADATLLIVAALEQKQLVDLLGEANRIGVHILTEAHSADEVGRALEAGAKIVGINSRDLKTFRMDANLAIRLKSLIPDGVVAVVESGIKNREDMEPYIAAGYRAFLIGEAIASATDVAAKLKELAR